MSPTVFKYKNYRFLFYSREETRVPVHVTSEHGEAKFWLDPVELAMNKGLKDHEISEILKITEERIDEIKESWRAHFPG